MVLPVIQAQSQLGGALQGLNMGAQQALPSIAEMVQSRRKQQQIQSILFPQAQKGSPPPPPPGQEKKDAQPDLSMRKQPDLTMQPQQQKFELTPEKIMAIHQIDPSMSGPLAQLYTAQEKGKKEERSIFAEGAKEYFTNLNKKREHQPVLKSSLEAQMNAVMKGDVDPFSRGHIADIARGLGAPASLVAPLETPGSKEFKTGLKTYLSSTLKDAFRGATTGREIDLAEGLLAQAGVSREGNLASIWLLQSQAMINDAEIALAKQLRQSGVSALEVPDMVAEQLEPIRKQLSDQYIQAIEEISKKK